jgi:ribosomal protein S19
MRKIYKSIKAMRRNSIVLPDFREKMVGENLYDGN